MKINDQLTPVKVVVFAYIGEKMLVEDLFLLWELDRFSKKAQRFDVTSFTSSFSLNRIPMSTITLPVGVRLNTPVKKPNEIVDTATEELLFGVAGGTGFSANEPFLVETTKLIPVLVSVREIDKNDEHVIFRGFITKKQINRAPKQQSLLTLELTHWIGLLDMVPMASPVVHTDTTGDLRFRAFKKPIMGGMNITSTMKTNPNELLIHDSVCRSFDFYTQKIKKSLKDRGVWWTVILVLEIYAKTQILFPKDIKVKHKEELQKIRNKTNKIITLLLNQLKQAAATEKTHVPARLDPTAKGFSETRTLAAIASAIILLLENSILTSSYWQYIVHIAGLFQLTIVPTIDVVTMEPSTCYPHYFALNVTDLISADTINTYSRPILGSISAISSSSSSGDALTRSDATPETHDVKAQKMSLMYNPYLDQGHPINGDDYDFSTISYNLTPDWLKFTNIPSANPADPAVKKGKVGQTGGSGSKQPVDNSYLINAITKENYFELLNRDKMLRFKDTLRYDMCPGTTIVVGTPATDEQKKQFARFAKNLGVCYGGIIHGVSQIIDCQAKVVCTDYSLTYSVPIPFVDSLAAGDAWAIHWVHELYNEPFFPRTCFNNNQNNYFAQKKHPIFGLNNVFIWRNLMK